jgi:ABC-2 type transport system permease protein
MRKQVWTLCRQELRLWVQRVDRWALLFVVPMLLISVFQAHIPGFSLMFVFFLATNLAVALVDERQAGTLRRLLVTPASRGAILLGKLLPYFLLAIVQFVVLFSVCNAVFGVEMGDAPLALGVVMVCAAASVAGLGIMIAALAKTKGQADRVPTMVIIAMAIVSGCIGPHITVPGIKYATPHYWALLGFQNVMVRGMGFSGVLLPCGVLLAFAVVFFIIGVRRFRFE